MPPILFPVLDAPTTSACWRSPERDNGKVASACASGIEKGDLMARNVLFLCTGNYYRSRFAEVLFNSVAGKMGLSWHASSRALALERGSGNVGPMALTAIQALEAMGIRDAQRCSRFPVQATPEDFATAHLVIALKHAEHFPLMQERFPALTETVEYWHVDDNHDALSLIEREVMDLMARLLGGGKSPEAPPQNEQTEQPPPAPAKKPITVKVGRETAGRRGKGVTTVFDLPLDENGLRELAGKLKAACGTGGTVKDGRIEIQGDQRDRLMKELEKLGYKVKKVGG
jgi:predicted translation initiation factor SUI1